MIGRRWYYEITLLVKMASAYHQACRLQLVPASSQRARKIRDAAGHVWYLTLYNLSGLCLVTEVGYDSVLICLNMCSRQRRIADLVTHHQRD